MYAIVLPENQLYHYFNKADLIKRLKGILSDFVKEKNIFIKV